MSAGEVILIVEDNPDVADMLRNSLEDEGFACRHASDGQQGLCSALKHPPDLILLDRILPRLSGDEVARRLKSDPRSWAIPLIMVTGKAEETDQLVGFALGADDYVPKPFSTRLLMARIRAQLRQKQMMTATAADPPASTIKLDRSQPRVFVDQTAIELTTTQHRLLAALMAAGGTVLHGQQLTTMVFGGEVGTDESDLAGQITGLRRKMGAAANCIQEVGPDDYAFCPPRPWTPSA
jgi:two-component system phosphate regulon response regulator PhoB